MLNSKCLAADCDIVLLSSRLSAGKINTLQITQLQKTEKLNSKIIVVTSYEGVTNAVLQRRSSNNCLVDL